MFAALMFNLARFAPIPKPAYFQFAVCGDITSKESHLCEVGESAGHQSCLPYNFSGYGTRLSLGEKRKSHMLLVLLSGDASV